MMATCFDRKTVITKSIKNICLRYNKVNTQWEPINGVPLSAQ